MKIETFETIESKRRFLVKVAKDNLTTALDELSDAQSMLAAFIEKKQGDLKHGWTTKQYYAGNGKWFTMESIMKTVSDCAENVSIIENDIEKYVYSSDAYIENTFELFELAGIVANYCPDLFDFE